MGSFDDSDVIIAGGGPWACLWLRRLGTTTREDGNSVR